MLLFTDSEFTGLRKDTTLISLGIVAEDGRKFYAEFMDYDILQINNWIEENVIDNLFLEDIYWSKNVESEIIKLMKQGYRFSEKAEKIDNSKYQYYIEKDEKYFVKGKTSFIKRHLTYWLSQFDSVQFVSDVCHYDFVLLIDIFGTAFDLPKNICAACHDINQDIACYYGISEQEAFDKSREKIVMELCGHEIEGRKHNALYDAEVIKMIYEKVNKQL